MENKNCIYKANSTETHLVEENIDRKSYTEENSVEYEDTEETIGTKKKRREKMKFTANITKYCLRSSSRINLRKHVKQPSTYKSDSFCVEIKKQIRVKKKNGKRRGKRKSEEKNDEKGKGRGEEKSKYKNVRRKRFAKHKIKDQLKKTKKNQNKSKNTITTAKEKYEKNIHSDSGSFLFRENNRINKSRSTDNDTYKETEDACDTVEEMFSDSCLKPKHNIKEIEPIQCNVVSEIQTYMCKETNIYVKSDSDKETKQETPLEMQMKATEIVKVEKEIAKKIGNEEFIKRNGERDKTYENAEEMNNKKKKNVKNIKACQGITDGVNTNLNKLVNQNIESGSPSCSSSASSCSSSDSSASSYIDPVWGVPFDETGIEITDNVCYFKFLNNKNIVRKFIFPFFKYGDQYNAKQQAVVLKIHMQNCSCCINGILCNYVEHHYAPW